LTGFRLKRQSDDVIHGKYREGKEPPGYIEVGKTGVFEVTNRSGASIGPEGEVTYRCEHSPDLTVTFYWSHPWSASTSVYSIGTNYAKGIANTIDPPSPKGHDQNITYLPRFLGDPIKDAYRRKTWMADIINKIGDKTLNKIAMPGSHDAAMYKADYCNLGACNANTLTQTDSIYQRLCNGIRVFDIRPCILFGKFFTAHGNQAIGGFRGCCGPELKIILGDVRKFMQETRELVILTFSHFDNRDDGRTFNREEMNELFGFVWKELGDHLYKKSKSSGRNFLAGLTINDYIAEKGCVLAVFDTDLLPIEGENVPLFTYGHKEEDKDLWIYNEYSDTIHLDKMERDQLTKLKNYENHDGRPLYFFSWTLTQDAAMAISSVTNSEDSIIAMASMANMRLPITLDANAELFHDPHLMANVIYTDCSPATSTDHCREINLNMK
jgi:hypothetical protein